MNDREWLGQRFETHRDHLRAVAYRMLGSVAEAEDAVQEAWLRLARADTDSVENLAGWLTTVVARVCLDMLRARQARPEQPVGGHPPESADLLGMTGNRTDPERETVLADSVGHALLLVLETLTPAERIAFVLHDTFAVPFAEIAPIVGRSPEATKKLAGRARRRVQARSGAANADLAGHRRVVDAFLAAIRNADMDALVAVLDPDVVRRVDPAALPAGVASEMRGARRVIKEARIFARRARFARPALINAALGAVVIRRDRPVLALTFTISNAKITEFEVIAAPDRLDQLDVALLDC